MIAAGFDFDVEAERSALNRSLRGFLALLLAQGITRFSQALGTLRLGPLGTLANFGTFSADVRDGSIDALRAIGTVHHGVEADFTVTVGGALTGVTVLGFAVPTITLELAFPFLGVGVDVDTTPQGVPSGIVLKLKGAHLGLIRIVNRSPTRGLPGLVFGFFITGLLALITAVLRLGFLVAAALVPNIPITIKQMIDAFAVFGLRFHKPGPAGNDSPFITAVADSLLIAGDFERLTPPPAGNSAQLADIRAPGSNVAAVLGQAGLNQAIDTLFLKGIIPSVFRAGGFKFHVKRHDLVLLGPAAAPGHRDAAGRAVGAVQILFEVRGKRDVCWCGVWVTAYIKATFWPHVEASPAPSIGLQPAPRQQSAVIKFDFDDLNRVKISGFLVAVTELLFGPLLMVYLFLLSQIADLVLALLLPYTFSTNVSGNRLTITASSASVAAYMTLNLEFAIAVAAQGTGSFDITQYTGFRLLKDPALFAAQPPAVQEALELKVDYNADSITVEDREIRMAANLLR